MGQIKGIYAQNCHFWADFKEILQGTSRDYYLSAMHEKLKISCIFSDFYFLGPLGWHGHYLGLQGLVPQNQTKKLFDLVDFLGEL